MEAPWPLNEQERLRALRSLDVLDTEFEEAFDRTTRLAAHIIGAPISVVSLVDEDRQWFKSVVGLDIRETPRTAAFCAHALFDDEVLVVPDATEDTRFRDNPFVVGEPGVRFYAGAPLTIDDSLRLGTLCVIDCRPRTITDEQRAALRDLAAIVVDELRGRKNLRAGHEDDDHLVEQARQLRLANQSLDQFAHMASHDLRAPLKRLVNVADLILGEPGLAEELLPVIRRSALQMEELVAGYLRLSTLQPETNQVARLSDLIDRAAGEVGPGITVRREGDGLVVGDPALLIRVFVNLFANAERHGSGEPVRCGSTQVEDPASGHRRVQVEVSNPVAGELRVDRTVFAPLPAAHGRHRRQRDRSGHRRSCGPDPRRFVRRLVPRRCLLRAVRPSGPRVGDAPRTR